MNDLIAHLEKKIEEYSRELIHPPRILVAISGGVDSVVLSEGLSLLSNLNTFSFGLAHINYGMRSDAYKAELFCSKIAKRLNVNFYKASFRFDSKGESFERWARDVRYKFLYRIADENSYDLIFTAHHWNDQLETLYMRFTQKSNWISMQGIREYWGKVRRPFLSINKEDMIQFAQQFKLKWIDDPTNEDISFLRNQIRHVLLPEALKEEPKLIENLFTRSHQAKKKFDEIINQLNINNLLISFKELEFVKIHKQEFLNLNKDQKKIAIKILISDYLDIENLSLSGRHWDSFWQFIGNALSGTVFELKQDILSVIDRECFLLYKYEKSDNKIMLNSPGTYNWNQNQFKVEIISSNRFKKSENKKFAIIHKNVFDVGISIRQWKYGDKIRVNRGKNRIKVSDLFIDKKISLVDKWKYPLIVNHKNEILWIPGLRHSSLIDIRDHGKENLVKIECT